MNDEIPGYIRLSTEHVQKIFDQEFCYLEIEPGNFVKVTVDDLYFKKEDIENLIKREKSKCK